MFWGNKLNPSDFNPENGMTIFLQNVAIQLQDYMVSQPRTLQSESSMVDNFETIWLLQNTFQSYI
jgi:hypothetical protein